MSKPFCAIGIGRSHTVEKYANSVVTYIAKSDTTSRITAEGGVGSAYSERAFR